jgi:hypothetical protein
LVVTGDVRRRLDELLAGARTLADPATPLGRALRGDLPRTTRLSPEGIELALRECLETSPSDAELDALCAAVIPALRAHVSLSSTVFVAAHRAIALALASSAHVLVRPSRRDPTFARALERATGGRLFHVVDALSPEAGDELWAYGSDATLGEIRRALPAGVRLQAHGSGTGVVVVDAASVNRDTALALARDIAPFDQRGCLSPRLALVRGDERAALAFSRLVAGALDELARRIPMGTLDGEERAEVLRYRDTLAYSGQLDAAGPGWVGTGATPMLAPVGRNLHVTATASPETLLAPLAPAVAALGVAGPPELRASLARTLPGARLSELGAMQRPPLDGPVDRRPALATARARRTDRDPP